MRNGDSKKRHSRKKWIVLFAVLFLPVISYFALGRIFPEDSRKLNSRIRESLEQEFPEQAAAVRARYGIRPAGAEACGMDPAHRNVVLVHGLDDPGEVWMNLRPKLEDKGFCVWIFSYPDDQAVSDSARFFFEEMKSLRKRGVAEVSVVAHSMGGLVTREMLTHPGISYTHAARNTLVPDISNLIMIATPNHGSEMARLRLVAEFRDQLSSLLLGDYVWFEGIMDGAGEAGIDLTPGSDFLEELNGRPHPLNLRMEVIAGVIDPLTSESIQQSGVGFLEARSGRTEEQELGILRFLDSMAFKLGDGLVPVESAKLDGYPLSIVSGTHLSIIRNLSGKSERVPPAIPVVLDYLESPVSD